MHVRGLTSVAGRCRDLTALICVLMCIQMHLLLWTLWTRFADAE